LTREFNNLGRLKKVLHGVIDEYQFAFVKKRGMLDRVIIANVVVEDLRRLGKSGLCIKMDYEKTYNSVR